MAETDWEILCGCDEHHFAVWKDGDFGKCFERLVFSCIPHGILAISSAYQIGKHWPLRFHGRIIYSVTLHFRHAFSVVLLLVAVALLIAGFLYREYCPGLINVVDCGFRGIAWLAHSRFVWSSHRFCHLHLRGPTATVLSFLLVHAASFVLLQSAVRQQIREARPLPTFEEWFFYGTCFVYVLYALTLLPCYRPPTPRTLHLQDSSGDLLFADGDTDSVDVSTIRSNLVSKITFSWVGPLMKRGSKGLINSVEDVFDLPSSLNTAFVSARFHDILCCDQGAVDSEYCTLPEHRTSEATVHERADENLSVRGQLLLSEYKHHATLLKGLMRTFGSEYFCVGLLKLFSDSLTFVGPIILNLLLNFMVDKALPVWHGYVYTAALLVSTLLAAIFSTHFNYHVTVVGLKFRAALVSTVYDKTLTVSSAVFSGGTGDDPLNNFSGTGEVVNLMSTDVDRVVNFCPSFHQLWSLPLQVAVTLYLLYLQVGVAFLAGVGFAVLLVPVNRQIAIKIADLSESLMAQKDARVKVINEALYGIRAIKLSAWESLFAERITVLRAAELRSLAARKYLDALCVFFWAATPVLISLLTFLTYVLLGNHLTAAKVFTSIALFGILIVPLNAFPWVVNGMMEAWVSINRLQRYMNLDSICWTQYYTMSDLTGSQHSEICIIDGSFAWQQVSHDGLLQEQSSSAAIDEPAAVGPQIDRSSDSESLLPSEAVLARSAGPMLSNINFTIPKGAFVGVTGAVGAGKTALLCTIAAEMQRLAGQVVIRKHVLTDGVGLTLQDAWVQHATLRDNILFGQPFDPQEYDAVIAACALQQDLKILPAGDKTEIGENGVTLSGGQKARVALARAVYQKKDVYLLDDPLAAVDVHVASQLYTECILGLLRHTTRVLVTHHVQFLHAADFVIVMAGGSIRQIGLPSDVLPSIRPGLLSGSSASPRDDAADVTDQENEANTAECGTDLPSELDDGVLVAEEERRSGVVRLGVYWSYWIAVGRCLATLVLLSILLMQASRNVSDWWLSYWISHSNSSSPNTNDTTYSIHERTVFVVIPDAHYQAAYIGALSKPRLLLTSPGDVRNDTSNDDLVFYLTVYGSLAAANSFLTLIRAFLFAYGGVKAAVVLHSQLLDAVLKAPVSFFDVTPIGRILNRFSSDVFSVDDTLPFILNIFLAQVFSLLGVVVVCCYGLPYISLLIALLTVVYYFIQKYYRHTSRELQRISSVTLSPIYAHFSETVNGIVTIRALRQLQRFRAENHERLEENQRAQFAGLAASQWLAMRLQLIGVVMVTGVATVAVIEHTYSTVEPGLVGLAISYILSMTGLLNGVVTYFTETEKQMVSVERIDQYISDIPAECQAAGLQQISLSWPQNGSVTFHNVCLRYRSLLPLALNNVSFEIRSGEKIGIVGRTGAGKSSLFLALLRLVEIETGSIVIDGINIQQVSLAKLRSKLAIIPQDPFLFSGTVRDNIDPQHLRSDIEISNAVERCRLADMVYRLGGLDGLIAEGGRMLSAGERQLVCLTRALLSQTQILCVDEATASVDQATDALVQTTLKQEFSGRTVLTIAHRIATVIDTSDRIMVMDVGGHLVEFAPPADLLSSSSSLLSALVSGSSSAGIALAS